MGERPVVVYTPNAFGYMGLTNPAARSLYRQVERWLGHHATDRLICVSRTERELARQQSIAPEEWFALVENAIEAADFQQLPDPTAARIELGLDPTRPVVGAVGRLAAQKGLDDLVRAARIVAESGSDAQFVLAGEGEYAGALERMITAHQLEGRVLLAGFYPDVRPVLAALDIYVLSSRFEGLSYSLMEAMAAGLPVVATDVVGNRDLIEDGRSGLLVPPANAPALARTLLRLLNEPVEREKLGLYALQAARSRPTPAQMAGQVIELYQSALQERRAG
jgi:glycosyltransferase involved in cell wall biosynthesis